MLVINMNTHPVSVKINSPSGADYVHLVPRGRVELAEGSAVDNNWLAVTSNIKVVANPQPEPKAE